MTNLLDRSHRGHLLDVVVLLVNLFGMNYLMGAFGDLARAAANDDQAAITTLFGFGVALLVLAPLGATLSRWHYHQHRGRGPSALDDGAAGCLFNFIFYFCLVAVIFSAVNAFLLQNAYGNDPPETVFILSILLGIAGIIMHTWLVYRYFSPPSGPPRTAFFRGKASAIIGDACLFANMLLFQLIWNALSFAGLGPPGGVGEAVLRLLVLLFLALLLYFPPRMFYLADDINQPLTWLMILLANAPVLARLVLGS